MRHILSVLTVLAVALSLCGCDGPRPSDAEIIARFRVNRAQIEQLMTMMRSDRVLTRVDDNWTDPADPTTVGISHERIAEYRRILNTIGFRRGFYYDPQSGRVTFIAWAVGFAGSGASKSLMYLPRDPPPSPLVADLDAYERPPGQQYVQAYRHIEGPWYLEVDGN
jgi:hypothetical protein